LGFSNALTSGTAGKTTVQVSDSSTFNYTQLANNTSMKEIVRALGVLKQLPPVEYAPGALNDPTATTLAQDVAPFPPREKQDNFYKVINNLISSLNKAVDDLDQLEFSLAQVQAQISIVKTSNSDQIKAYQDIVGEVEDSDITEVSVKIKQLEIQIQASFQVTSLASQLTLSNFLSR
jgi:flagellar hook-associated protein 3 FlgL